jgi:hypothetical protein
MRRGFTNPLPDPNRLRLLMKFLCRNCKAKYQIADEKVTGRTLRMTCQQCGEPIVVRGPARGSQAAARPVAPVALGGTPQGSALGAEFQRQLSAPGRELASSLHEEWHVAINDVPVGPMRRDEVGRKIAVGAIGRESLAWREGMDDWLEIRHIAELAALFPLAQAATHAVPGAPLPAASRPSVPAPSARADMAPIGGRQVAAMEEYAAIPEPETVPPSAAPLPAASLPAAPLPAAPLPAAPLSAAPIDPPSALAAPQRRLGWPQLFAIVSAVAFSVATGAYLGVRWLSPATPASAPVAAAPAERAGSAPAQPAEPSAPNNNVIELDMQAIDGTSNSAPRKPNADSTAQNAAADKKPAPKPLTAEQKEMLARMGGGLNQGPSNLRSSADANQHGPSQGGGQLTAEQLSGVVLNGRKNLQRCYETALRGANSTDTVRLDVDIQVSPAGNVTSVHTSGKGLPGMDDCIVRTVRMWRFPMSADVTQTRFPVVFQPGA